MFCRELRFIITARTRFITILLFSASLLTPIIACAQIIEDGSDVSIGKPDTQTVLDLIGRNLDKSLDPKVTSLRRGEGSIICGSVNVKNRNGLYLGERGFVADVSAKTFGRVPEGPELLNPHSDGFETKERIRELYFKMCLD